MRWLIVVLMIATAEAALGQDNQAHLRCYDEQEIKEFLSAFASCDGIRTLYLSEADKYAAIELRLRQLSPPHKLIDIEIVNVDDKEGSTPLIVENVRHVDVDGKRLAYARRNALHKTPDGLRMDFPSAVGFNPTTLVAWKAGAEPRLMLRSKAKLVDLFKGAYSDSRSTHLAVGVFEPLGLGEGSDRKIVAYAEKASEVGKWLLEKLKDGEMHDLTLTLTSEVGGKDTPAIAAVNSEGWYYNPNAPSVVESLPQAPIVAKQEADQPRLYRHSGGRMMSMEDIKRHNDKVLARSLRRMTGQNDLRKREEEANHIQHFTAGFLGIIMPAYGDRGTDSPSLGEAMQSIANRPRTFTGIQYSLDHLLMGDFLVVTGEEVKTSDEVWNECLLVMVQTSK